MHSRDMSQMRPCPVAAADPGAESSVPPVWQRPIRVLALEDDPDIRDLLSVVLSVNEGFAVEIVDDVAGCLKQLHASVATEDPAPFDVLLLDLALRDGHLGTEVLRAAAQPEVQWRLPPVVVCTGHSAAYLASHAPEIAASKARVLPKPFDIDDLAAELRMVALGHQTTEPLTSDRDT